LVSFVFDRAHRGLLAKAPVPKEASRIACDRNKEEECEALAADAPTRGVQWPQEGSYSVEKLEEGDASVIGGRDFGETLQVGASLWDRALCNRIDL
jgi:hypothetical protein